MRAHQDVSLAHGADVRSHALLAKLARGAAHADACPAGALLEQLRKIGDASQAAAVLVQGLRPVHEQDAPNGRRRLGRAAHDVRGDILRGPPRRKASGYLLVGIQQRLEAADEQPLVASRGAALGWAPT